MVASACLHFDKSLPKQKPLNFKEVFYLATLGGARALRLDASVGSLVVGKQFDALVLNAAAGPIDVFDDQSLRDNFQKLVLLSDDRNIEHVFVAGRRVAGSGATAQQK